jgi:transposase InsO family protein
LGDGSVKKVQFVGKIDLVFHSRTDHPVTLYDVSFVPDLGFNLFSFHVVQEKHDILLNKTGAHMLGGRLVFPRRKNGSSLRATRVVQGTHVNASTALASFSNPPPHRSDGSSNNTAQYRNVASEEEKNSEFVLSRKDGMAAAVLSPGNLLAKKKVVDINHFHVSLSHAHSSVLKATAQQHGIQLVGELAPCSGCSMAKGIRAPTPHHTTSRAVAPLDRVHIDTAGPFPESVGGSRYVVMFVDSASRFQRPYGTRDKSASAILGVVRRFVADMGVPKSFRTDNGTEYTNSAFVDYCNNLRIRRELTAPYTPQQNGPVESGLSRAIKAGHAARLEVNRLFPNVHLERLKGVRDPDGSSLWMESVLWASEGFNRSATTANSGMLSPYEVFYRRRPQMPVLPFCKPAYHRVPRQTKMDRQARPCFFLNFGYNHGSDCVKIMDAETGRIVYSRDVTWHQPREPFISPAPTAELGVPHSPYATGAPNYVQIRPTSAPSASATTPIAAPVPASDHAAPAPPQDLPAPIPRVVRELGHEAEVRMPGRTRGETRALRESPRNMGLMSHAALAQGLATREAFDEAFRDYEIPLPSAELPTAPFRLQMRTP